MKLSDLKILLKDLGIIDPKAIHNLSNINLIAEKGTRKDGTLSLSAMHEIVHYIEKIKIENKSAFFEPVITTVAKKLIDDHKQVLPLKDLQIRSPFLNQNEMFQEKISPRSYKIFATIHNYILSEIEPNLRFIQEKENQKALKNSKNPAWVHVFEKTDDGQIMNDSIGIWQDGLMQPLGKEEQKKVLDFYRTWSIRGLVVQNEQELDELLAYLVQSANYLPEHEELLKQWIAVRGQEVKDFTLTMLQSGAITGHQNSISNIHLLQANWTVEKGALVFNFEMAIPKLVFPDGSCKVNKGNRLVEIEADNKVDTSKNSPILKLKTKIELEVEKDEQNNAIVTPKVTSLVVACNCPEIKEPKEIPDKQIKPH